MYTIFCDFDGTITNFDLLDEILKYGYGDNSLDKIESDLISEKISHNDLLRKMIEPLNINITEMIDIIEGGGDPVIMPDFKDFYDKCHEHNYKFYVISGGFKNLISHYLPYIHPKDIYANEYVIKDGKHSINFLQNTHNKDLLVSPLKRACTKSVFIGDGTSDISIVGKVDMLFAKKNTVLDKYCRDNSVPYYSFCTFSDITDILFPKLLSPGVVRSSPSVLNALSYQHTFMHRQDPFHDLHFQLDKKIKDILCSKPDEYISLIVTGSGTSSMDEVINACVGHGRTLFLSNGMFGERWQTIGKFYNEENVIEYRNEWGTPFDLDKLKEKIMEENVENVIMVHCDTSVGILNPIEAVGSMIKSINKDIKFIVDCVSSLASIPINMDNSHIDILVSNPNKGFAAHMGIGLIIGRCDVLEKFETNKCGSYSLNLKRHYILAKKGETMNSVSISSVVGLLSSISENFNHVDDINSNHKDQIEMFNYMYENVNYNKLLHHSVSSPSIITILCDNSNDIIDHLGGKGYVVYPCKMHLEGYGFQVSFYGHDAKLENIKDLVVHINNYHKINPHTEITIDDIIVN